MGRWVRWLFWLLLVVQPAMAASPSNPEIPPNGLSLVAHATVLADPSATLTIDQVMDKAWRGAFSRLGRVDDYTLPIGLSDHPYWVRIALPPMLEARSRPWYLRLGYYYRNDVQVFIDGERRWHTGNLQPMESRPTFDTQYAFPIDPARVDDTIFIRVASKQNLNLRLVAWSPHGYERHTARTNALQFAYAGAMSLLVVFNLVFGIALRDRNFLVYSLFTLSVAAAMLGSNGYLRLYLWPDAPIWDQASEPILYSCVVFFGALLALLFVEVPRRYRWLDRWLYFSMLVAVTLIVLLTYTALDRNFVPAFYGVGVPLLWVTAALVIARGVIAHRAGQREVRFLIAGWIALWLGISVATAWSLGLLPGNVSVIYAAQFGSVIEAVLLSMALGGRVLKVKRSATYAEAAQAEAEASRDRLARLSALVSHEFRNPLGIVNNQLYLMNRKGDALSEGSRQRMASIQAAIDRLTRLVDQWFHTHALVRGELDAECWALDPAEWLERQVTRIRQCFPDHCLRFDIQPAATVMAHPPLLETALFNLIDNACKYAPAGSCVDIVLSADGHAMHLCVLDEGPGVATGDSNAIFEEFYRGSEASHVPGLGLGLAFVAEVMRVHGGRVSVCNRAEGGARFTLTLPMAHSKGSIQWSPARLSS